jgi:hypothetical protein
MIRVPARKGFVLTLLLSFALVAAAHAVTTTTTNSFTKYSGTEGWSCQGELTYSANTGMGVVFYSWTGNPSTRVYLNPDGNYVDDTVYWRAVIVYDPPGTNSVVWDSSEPDDMEHGPLTAGQQNIKSYTQDAQHNTFNGNSSKDVIFKVQSGPSQSDLGAAQFTLQKQI